MAVDEREDDDDGGAIVADGKLHVAGEIVVVETDYSVLCVHVGLAILCVYICDSSAGAV